jgi:hypothetical protein
MIPRGDVRPECYNPPPLATRGQSADRRLKWEDGLFQG